MQRHTVQRDLILQTVHALHGVHPSAQQVYTELHRTHPSVSRATVYRVLNSLVEEEVLIKIPMPDGADRFDDTLSPHLHFQCRACSSTMDMEGTMPELPLPPITSAYTVEGHSLTYYGLCDACNQKGKNN